MGATPRDRAKAERYDALLQEAARLFAARAALFVSPAVAVEAQRLPLPEELHGKEK